MPSLNHYYKNSHYPLQVGTHSFEVNFKRDGNTRSPYLSSEKSVYRSRGNSENQAQNNRLVPNWKRRTSRLYIVTLLI